MEKKNRYIGGKILLSQLLIVNCQWLKVKGT